MSKAVAVGEAPVPVLVGWAAIIAVTALMFWGTLQPPSRRIV